MLFDPRSMSAEEIADEVMKRFDETAATKEPQSKKAPKRKRP
jgi:hypothetical protein